MDSRKLVFQETAIVLIGQAVCIAAMFGIFALLGILFIILLIIMFIPKEKKESNAWQY